MASGRLPVANLGRLRRNTGGENDDIDRHCTRCFVGRSRMPVGAGGCDERPRVSGPARRLARAGVIENRWDQAVSKLVTAVEAIDAAGQVIDHGEDVDAYPLNLAPGAQAPYSASINATSRRGSFRVAVEECVAAEELERSKVEVRGQRVSSIAPATPISPPNL